MGSGQEEFKSNLAVVMDTTDQDAQALAPSQKCNEEEGGSGNGLIKPKGSMTNTTIGDEDHIVIRDRNTASGECDVSKEKSPIYENHSGSNGRAHENIINDVGNSNENGESKDNQVDKELKGEFFVFEKEGENGSLSSEIDQDLHVLDKGLTLVVCKPDMMASIPSGDPNHEPSSTDKAGNDDYCDRTDDNAPVDNKETQKIYSQNIDSEIAVQNNRPKNDCEGESVKRGHDENNVPTNHRGKGEIGEIHQPDRFPTHSRKYIKHAKNRRQVQDTVPEIDEANENTQHPAGRDGREKNNYVNSANPKTRQHQNKVGGRHNYPIKEDLHVNSSQTVNSTLNYAVSPLKRPASARPDISRLSTGTTINEEKTMLYMSRRVNSFVSGIPQASDPVGNGESRLSFDCTSSTDSPKSESRNRGFVSNFERRYTRMELRKALPRKSFFNCHEKAMKDAGLVVEDAASKRKAERLKAKLERIAREFDPLPTRVVLETAKENTPEVSVLLTSEQTAVSDLKDEENENPNDKDESDDIGPVDAVDGRSKTDSRGLSNPMKKKRLHPEKPDYVECKPLVHYLEYVKDNQSEFESQRHVANASAKNKPVTRLISMGKAFELRHRGGSPKTKDDDVIVLAAKALRPRSCDASRYPRQERDKSGLRGQDPSLRQTRPPSDDKRRQEKNSPNTNTTKDEEHAKSELEKKKIRAEEWAMSVPTNTLTKAKIQTLRELGTDDDELTKWWIALKKCHYLRGSGLSGES